MAEVLKVFFFKGLIAASSRPGTVAAETAVDMRSSNDNLPSSEVLFNVIFIPHRAFCFPLEG